MLKFSIAQERQATSVVTRFLRFTTNTPSMITRPLCGQVCEIQFDFPQIKIALGGLDDSKLLEKEAAKADIVIRTLKILSNLIAMLI
jgi:hypothetical protein